MGVEMISCDLSFSFNIQNSSDQVNMWQFWKKVIIFVTDNSNIHCNLLASYDNEGIIKYSKHCKELS